MALSTFLDIFSQDAQGVKGTLTFRIVDAAFSAATDLPPSAKIDAIIAAVFGDNKLSTNIVTGYQVRVVEELDSLVGGAGDVGTSTSLRVRHNYATLPFLTAIPAVAKSNLVFDPGNPAAVSTSGALWDALRTALVDADIAISAPTGDYAAVAEAAIAENATVYDGRRTPPRPR